MMMMIRMALDLLRWILKVSRRKLKMWILLTHVIEMYFIIDSALILKFDYVYVHNTFIFGGTHYFISLK